MTWCESWYPSPVAWYKWERTVWTQVCLMSRCFQPQVPPSKSPERSGHHIYIFLEQQRCSSWKTSVVTPYCSAVSPVTFFCTFPTTAQCHVAGGPALTSFIIAIDLYSMIKSKPWDPCALANQGRLEHPPATLHWMMGINSHCQMYYHFSLISTDIATAGSILVSKGMWSTIQKAISEEDLGRHARQGK